MTCYRPREKLPDKVDAVLMVRQRQDLFLVSNLVNFVFWRPTSGNSGTFTKNTFGAKLLDVKNKQVTTR